MKTLKFKSTEASQGHCTLANPQATPGMKKGVITYQVEGIPEDIETSQVALLLTNTTTFLAEKQGRFTFQYSELGHGKIIK